MNSRLTWSSFDVLAFTRYCFTSRLLCESESSLSCLPICIAHTIAIRLHGYCAIYDPPPTTLVYAIHHTKSVLAISCKGQMLYPCPMLTRNCTSLSASMQFIVPPGSRSRSIYLSIYHHPAYGGSGTYWVALEGAYRPPRAQPEVNRTRVLIIDRFPVWMWTQQARFPRCATVPLHGVSCRACCGHGRSIFSVAIHTYIFLSLAIYIFVAIPHIQGVKRIEWHRKELIAHRARSLRKAELGF